MFFVFIDTATTDIYTLSLHDALPIYVTSTPTYAFEDMTGKNSSSAILAFVVSAKIADDEDRKSTRLNSSHTVISYAVFCLKKKTRGRSECSPMYPQR